MLANLEGMTFFDPSVIPEKLHYLSGYRELEQDGLKGLLDLVRRGAQQHQATLLTIDGMDTAREFARTDLSFKRFLQDLQTFCGILGCTTLLLAPHREGDSHPETTAAARTSPRIAPARRRPPRPPRPAARAGAPP
jgi:circadian clock protein KaiC